MALLGKRIATKDDPIYKSGITMTFLNGSKVRNVIKQQEKTKTQEYHYNELFHNSKNRILRSINSQSKVWSGHFRCRFF